MTYSFLQTYWWFIVSLLAGLLVFLLFVQGGNFWILIVGKNEDERKMLVNSTGRKWEFTFTTLVLFGGAFFASFPLFYSTSFGGAYWVWMLLLLTFVFQAVSYEFQNKKGNILGTKTFRVFLAANGLLAPILIGTAVGTFFTGSNFTVNKTAIADSFSPVISTWGTAWHGLEAVANPWNVLLGISVFLLAAFLGALYSLNNISDDNLNASLRRKAIASGLAFVVCFVVWLIHLCVADGFAVDASGVVFMESYKYLHNFLQMPIVLVVFLLGVVLVLSGFCLTAFTKSKKGIWPAGVGTVLTVLGLLLIAGLNGTAYYPSSADLQSSLTIANSSSSFFTLKTMFWVSLVVPFVLAYIAYAWYLMDKKPITKEEINSAENKY